MIDGLFQNALRPATASFAPHQAIDIVRNVLPREGILAFDVGAHTHQIGSQWTAHAPRTFLTTNGWSSMGFGIPAAIAAKLARPDLPVVCILGDGCFQMTCGEVAVARRQGLSIPFVVLNDHWLSLIKVKQERLGLPYYGTEVSPGDSPSLPAHYFGVRAVGVDSSAGLERELRKAFAADGPTIIEAAVDGAHYSQTVYDLELDGFTDALKKGGRIEIRGFGSFCMREYDGYTGRNPKTGAQTVVRAKKLPFFRVGKELKEGVNAG